MEFHFKDPDLEITVSVIPDAKVVPSGNRLAPDNHVIVWKGKLNGQPRGTTSKPMSELDAYNTVVDMLAGYKQVFAVRLLGEALDKIQSK